MTLKNAHRRYMKLFVPSMLLYLVSIFAISYLRKNTDISPELLIALTMIPVLSILAWIWGHWRYVNELDEFLQKLHTQALLIAIGGVMTIATFWGLLEEVALGANIPHFPIFYIIPVFFVINGLALFIIMKRAGVKDCGSYL